LDDDVALIMKIQADKNIILYRPEVARVVGGAAAAIFLQQVQYWWVQQGFKSFYKLNSPCNHKFYKAGDSWCEELGFSASNLRTARRLVAVKKRSGTTMQEARLQAMTGKKAKPVIYWTSAGRLTYYTIHPPAYLKILRAAYLNGENEESRIRRMLLGREEELNAESAFSKMQNVHLGKSTKCIYLNAESAFRRSETTIDHQRPTTTESNVVVDGWNLADQFSEEQNRAFQNLVSAGVLPQAAAELVVKHAAGLGRIQSWIDHAARLAEEGFEFKNYAGFIIAGLRSNQAALLP